MNLPEYRRELTQAIRDHADAVEKAASVLHDRIAKTNEAFFDDDETRPAREAEYVRERRDRD